MSLCVPGHCTAPDRAAFTRSVHGAVELAPAPVETRAILDLLIERHVDRRRVAAALEAERHAGAAATAARMRDGEKGK